MIATVLCTAWTAFRDRDRRQLYNHIESEEDTDDAHDPDYDTQLSVGQSHVTGLVGLLPEQTDEVVATTPATNRYYACAQPKPDRSTSTGAIIARLDGLEERWDQQERALQGLAAQVATKSGGSLPEANRDQTVPATLEVTPKICSSGDGNGRSRNRASQSAGSTRSALHTKEKKRSRSTNTPRRERYGFNDLKNLQIDGTSKLDLHQGGKASRHRLVKSFNVKGRWYRVRGDEDLVCLAEIDDKSLPRAR